MGWGKILGGAASGAGAGAYFGPWGIAAGALGGALLGSESDKAQQKALHEYNMGQAAQTRFSPWTGMAGQIERDKTNNLGDTMSGVATGAAMYQMGQGLAETPKATPDVEGYKMPEMGASAVAAKPELAAPAPLPTTPDELTMPQLGASAQASEQGLVNTDFGVDRMAGLPSLYGQGKWGKVAAQQQQPQYNIPPYLAAR